MLKPELQKAYEAAKKEAEKWKKKYEALPDVSIKEQATIIYQLPKWAKIAGGVLLVGLVVLFIVLLNTKKAKEYNEDKYNEMVKINTQIQKRQDSILKVIMSDNIREAELENDYNDQKKKTVN